MKTYLHSEKKKSNQSAANALLSKNNLNAPFQFTDNRPEAIQMSKFQDSLSRATGFHNSNKAPIQRQVQLSSSGNSVESDGNRPSSHLNKGTIKKVIQDILKNGAHNQVEKDVLKVYNSKGKNITTATNYIKSNSWLTNNVSDICHKVPYKSMENVVIKFCNAVLNKTLTSNNLNYFKKFIKDIDPSLLSKVQPLRNASKHTIVKLANTLLRKLDAAPDNLKFGYANSNRSLGQHFDFHYNTFSTGTTAEPPSPRGPKIANSLLNLEDEFSLSNTTQDVVMSESSGNWTMTSDVYGKKSDDTGQIFATDF